jgi:PBP1b-binding outer membrane lipoprotein LpoB
VKTCYIIIALMLLVACSSKQPSQVVRQQQDSAQQQPQTSTSSPAVAPVQSTVQPTPEVAAFCAQVSSKFDAMDEVVHKQLAKFAVLPETEKQIAHALAEKVLADSRATRHDVCSAANLQAAKAALSETSNKQLTADAENMFNYEKQLDKEYFGQQVSQKQDVDDRHPSPALQSARNVEARRLRQSSFGVTSTDITYGTLWLDVNGPENERDYNHFICKSKLDQSLWSKLRFNFRTDHAMDIPLPVPCQ